MRTLMIVLTLAGCAGGKSAPSPAPAAVDAAPAATPAPEAAASSAAVIRESAGLTALVGQRLTVVGTLTLRDASAGVQAAGLTLADGGWVWLAEDGFPHGWDGLAGQPLRVTGTLSLAGPLPLPGSGAAPQLLLSDLDGPIPEL